GSPPRFVNRPSDLCRFSPLHTLTKTVIDAAGHPTLTRGRSLGSRLYRTFVAVSASVLLLLSALVVSGILPLSSPGNRFGSGSVSSEATGNFDQLVVVLMENKNLNEVYGPAPYMP